MRGGRGWEKGKGPGEGGGVQAAGRVSMGIGNTAPRKCQVAELYGPCTTASDTAMLTADRGRGKAERECEKVRERETQNDIPCWSCPIQLWQHVP